MIIYFIKQLLNDRFYSVPEPVIIFCYRFYCSCWQNL